nr:putative glycosyl transferase [Plesiomonas shigelloides]
MPVYRDDGFLFDAVNSILNQTHKELELIIIANGVNCDDVESMLISKFNDSRIKILKTKIGQLPFALNLGVSAANGNYIARMDGDDISHPDRIKKQLDFMIKRNVDIVGSDYQLIDEGGFVLKYIKTNTGSDEIKKKLYLGSQFCHPAVMMKKDILIKSQGYSFGFFSEDYELWIRLMYEYGAIGDNISEPLLNYRVHGAQATDSSNSKRNKAYAISLGVLSMLKYRKLGFVLSIFWQCEFIRKFYFSLKKLYKRVVDLL